VHEARLRIELGLRRPELLDVLDDLTAGITIVPVAALEPLLSRCETALREAVASRNGSTRDACVLALAWSVEGDIWTTIATSPEPASPLGRRPISCVGRGRGVLILGPLLRFALDEGLRLVSIDGLIPPFC
jgi:hypothetical protein